ncbi:hypothetical protein F383_10276 [Gossypium arboreum]|uniref:Uncharacterized protein n=1 Tax=Gossypium arboreum TaxID=29729 RepID=A0A0B0PQ00_GOSAR|nr:hypothetical protein F383_10276 [Gossypium arboreum]
MQHTNHVMLSHDISTYNQFNILSSCSIYINQTVSSHN